MKRILSLALCLFAAGVTFAQSYEPKWVGDVNIITFDTDTVAAQAEKSNVQIKTSDSAGRILFGIGNTRRKIVIKGGRSTVQLQPTDTITLIVRCKDNDYDPTSFIQVVKFEEKKKERKAEISNVNWLGSVSEGNLIYVPYQADKYGAHSYILKFKAEHGEYGVRNFNPENVDERSMVFYCFGLH